MCQCWIRYMKTIAVPLQYLKPPPVIHYHAPFSSFSCLPSLIRNSYHTFHVRRSSTCLGRGHLVFLAGLSLDAPANINRVTIHRSRFSPHLQCDNWGAWLSTGCSSIYLLTKQPHLHRHIRVTIMVDHLRFIRLP